MELATRCLIYSTYKSKSYIFKCVGVALWNESQIMAHSFGNEKVSE